MRISGIAVVSSIAIPETVSLSSLQFQVSHNTTLDSPLITNQKSGQSDLVTGFMGLQKNALITGMLMQLHLLSRGGAS